MSSRGTATVEWTALVLTVSLVLGAMVAVVPGVDIEVHGWPTPFVTLRTHR